MDLDECLEYALSVQEPFDWRQVLTHPTDGEFTKAIKAIEDPYRLKAFFTTRRGAKSYTDGVYMYKEALENPGCNILYLGLTKGSAVGIIWKDILVEINDKWNLGGVPNLTEHYITLPNGSVIYISGVDVDENERKKLFGRKYRLVVLDEAALYGIDLRDLVYVVLRPSLADMRGTLVLSGMASDITRGLFYDITTHKEQGWSLHTWSTHDNPWMKNQWAEELAFIAEQQPLLMKTARFRQAYLNEWVVDEEKLVYRFKEEGNTFDELPYPHSKGWTFVLGVDLGWEDDNAFVLTAYHENDPCLYIVKTHNRPKMTFDQVADKITEFMNYPTQKPYKVVIDGANKQGVESMRFRTSIPFDYADKQGKADFIEILNGDFSLNRVKIQKDCVALIAEMKALIWKTDGEHIIIPRKEDPRLPNHLCDATLYAWRNGYHFLAKPAKVVHLPGTPEYIKEQEDLHKQALREKIQRDEAVKSGNGMEFFQRNNQGRHPWNEWD